MIMEKRVLPIDNVLIHRFEDEAVLLNLNNEVYYSLNLTGYMMWQVLTTADSVSDALDILGKQFEIDAETLQKDLEAFIEQLLQMELIEVQP